MCSQTAHNHSLGPCCRGEKMRGCNRIGDVTCQWVCACIGATWSPPRSSQVSFLCGWVAITHAGSPRQRRGTAWLQSLGDVMGGRVLAPVSMWACACAQLLASFRSEQSCGGPCSQTAHNHSLSRRCEERNVWQQSQKAGAHELPSNVGVCFCVCLRNYRGTLLLLPPCECSYALP